MTVSVISCTERHSKGRGEDFKHRTHSPVAAGSVSDGWRFTAGATWLVLWDGRLVRQKRTAGNRTNERTHISDGCCGPVRDILSRTQKHMAVGQRTPGIAFSPTGDSNLHEERLSMQIPVGCAAHPNPQEWRDACGSRKELQLSSRANIFDAVAESLDQPCVSWSVVPRFLTPAVPVQDDAPPDRLRVGGGEKLLTRPSPGFITGCEAFL